MGAKRPLRLVSNITKIFSNIVIGLIDRKKYVSLKKMLCISLQHFLAVKANL